MQEHAAYIEYRNARIARQQKREASMLASQVKEDKEIKDKIFKPLKALAKKVSTILHMVL